MSPDPRPPVSDQTSSPETWVCRASHVAYGYCTSPVGVLPGHGACGPAVPPAPTPEPQPATEHEASAFMAHIDARPAPLPDTGDGRPPLDWVCRRSVGSCTADAPHAGSMCGPEDVPSLDELRRGVTSEATCDRCGRQTWTEREVMRFCRMTQPSGDECAGTLRPAAPPAPTPEPEPAPAPPAVPGDRPDADALAGVRAVRSWLALCFADGMRLTSVEGVLEQLDAALADAQPAHPAPDGANGLNDAVAAVRVADERLKRTYAARQHAEHAHNLARGARVALADAYLRSIEGDR